MSTIDQEIHHLQTQISHGKASIKEAIKNGAVFEDVKAMTERIKEMERTLQALQNNLPGKLISNVPD